jgi:DNA-binding NarL/FixJ family response regulator
MSNPWGLTPREAQVMDLMLARGSVKGVAKSLGLSIHTVIMYMREARRKMAPPHKLGHFIAWDRWRTAQLIEQAKAQLEAKEPV